MAAIKRRRLGEPDEIRRFAFGEGHLTRLGTLTIGRALLRPGWRWSSSLGASMGTSSCPIHHTHILLDGRFAVQMDDGEFEQGHPVPPRWVRDCTWCAGNRVR